jgi:NitT/TauT family transport system permease protein
MSAAAREESVPVALAVGLPIARSRGRGRSSSAALALATVLLGLWYAGAGLLKAVDDPVADSKLPYPHLVVERFFSDFDRVSSAAWTSLSMALLGFLIGSIVGLLFGVLLTQAPWTEAAFMPYLLSMQMIPIIALVPLAQSVLKSDVTSRLFIAAFVTILPVTLGAVRGLRSAPEEARELMASYDAGRLATLRLLLLPNAVPLFFTGLRIAAPLSLLGAVLVDLMGGSNGLGQLILAAQLYGPTHGVLVWVAVVVLIILGVLFAQAIGLLERLVAPWETARLAATQRGEGS